MTFEEKYFEKRNYSAKNELVKRHVLEVLRWASDTTKMDLLNGRGKRALDVGCAVGYTTLVLSDAGYETYAVDISDWGIKKAHAKGNNQFLVCDAQNPLPFLNKTFDLVTCFDVLEHLTCPEKTLKSMFEAAKGIIVCTTPNKKVEKLIRRVTGDYDETHINVKSPAAWFETIRSMNGDSKVATFYDCAISLSGKLFFKSFRIPTYGLTVRIVMKK